MDPSRFEGRIGICPLIFWLSFAPAITSSFYHMPTVTWAVGWTSWLERRAAAGLGSCSNGTESSIDLILCRGTNRIGFFLDWLISKSLKKAGLREGKTTRSACNKWRAVVLENLWEVVSLLVTCRKGKQGGEEGGERRAGLCQFFPFFVDSFF
jgi:hypothetical protein